MADNFSFTPGTGATGAADNIGSVLYPRVKLTWGVDGTATDASASAPLPVDGSGVTQPISATSLPLPSGAATAAKQDTGNTSVGSIDTKTPALGQALSAASVPVVLPAAQVTALTPPAAITGYALDTTLGTTNTELGGLTETAPTTDTASSGLNGRLQRIAQRLTSLIGLLPAALGAGGGLKVDGSGTALPVSGTVTANAGTNLNTSALALETGGNLATIAGAVSSSKMATKAASGDFADGSIVTIGAKADAKSTATDTTAITAMSVWKQISASVQAIATSVAGTLTVATHAVTQSGTWNVTVNTAIAAGTNLIGKFGIDQTTVGTTNGISVAQIGANTVLTGNGTTGTGSQRVTIASDNTAFSVNATTVPATSGGLTTYHLASAGSTNATNVKASAGQLYGYMISNTSAAYSYVAFHNSASAPTAGASVFFKIGIPAGGAANVEFSNGVAFSSGIGITTVTGAADSNSTAVAANDLIINLFYK